MPPPGDAVRCRFWDCRSDFSVQHGLPIALSGGNLAAVVCCFRLEGEMTGNENSSTADDVSISEVGRPRCVYPDGTPVPEPGLSTEAANSMGWGPMFGALYMDLSDGDRSTVVGALQTPGAAVLTARCSPNDIFFSHMSLVGWSEVVPDGVPAELAKLPIGQQFRSYKITDLGRSALPNLLSLPRFRR